MRILNYCNFNGNTYCSHHRHIAPTQNNNDKNQENTKNKHLQTIIASINSTHSNTNRLFVMHLVALFLVCVCFFVIANPNWEISTKFRDFGWMYECTNNRHLLQIVIFSQSFFFNFKSKLRNTAKKSFFFVFFLFWQNRHTQMKQTENKKIQKNKLKIKQIKIVNTMRSEICDAKIYDAWY